jgi:hypothetical protein
MKPSKFLVPLPILALQVGCASDGSIIRTDDPGRLLAGPYFEVAPADVELIGSCVLDGARFPALSPEKKLTVFKIRPTWSRSSVGKEAISLALLDGSGDSFLALTSAYTVGYAASRLLDSSSEPVTVSTADSSSCSDDQRNCQTGEIRIDLAEVRDAAIDCNLDFDHVLVGVSTDSFGVVESAVSNEETTCYFFGTPGFDEVEQVMVSPPVATCMKRSEFVNQLVEQRD